MVHVEDDNYLSTTVLEDDGYRLGKFRRYKTWDTLKGSFTANNPVSTVLLQDGNLYAVIAGGNCYQIK